MLVSSTTQQIKTSSTTNALLIASVYSAVIDPRKKAQSSVRSSSDPFNKLSAEEITEYAALALSMYQKVMGNISSKSVYSMIMTNIAKNTGTRYVDEDFPPNIHSLAGDNLMNRPTWKAYNWLRAEQFMSGDVQLFAGDVSPTDIFQGALGDCYFLSTLASIAEKPQRIKRIFEAEFQDKSQEDIQRYAKKFGCYCVKIYDMGVPMEVIVDDFVPCISKTQGPAFTRTNQSELWVLLLEKAWAKTYVSYDNIEAGLTREALHDLTGAPTKTIWTDQPELWENILKGEKRNWIMTAGSNDSESGSEDVAANGIVAGHAYSLLAGYEFKDPRTGSNVRLVKLRNPWGDVEWNGKWSDRSADYEVIPREYKEEGRKDNDGIFFMEFADFCGNFSDAQFCIYNDDYEYSFLKTTLSKKHGAYFRVNVTKKGNYFFTVNQKSKRKYAPTFQEEFEYSTMTMVVAKKVGKNKFVYVEGKQKADREVWTAKGEDAELDEGVYVVYVKAQWNYKDEESICLSVYGAGPVEIAEMIADDRKEFLTNVYLSYAQSVSPRKTNLAKFGAPNCYMCVDQTDDGYAFAAVWNNENDKNVKCEFRFKNLAENKMRLKGKFQGDCVAKFTLGPGEEEAVVVRIKDYAKACLSFSQSIAIEQKK